MIFFAHSTSDFVISRNAFSDTVSFGNFVYFKIIEKSVFAQNIQISVLILLIIFKRNPEIQQTTFLGHPHSTVSIKSEAVTFSQVGMILQSYCEVTVFYCWVQSLNIDDIFSMLTLGIK